MPFERQKAFQMHKIVFFPEKKCNLPKTLPKIFRPVTQNTLIFLFGLNYYNLTHQLLR